MLPGLADLAEDLALADDHRVEPGGDAEQVRHRRVVVVRVQLLAEHLGIDAGLLGEEVADVVDAVVEPGGPGVDLGAVARREQHDLGQVLPTLEVVERLGQPVAGHGHPLEQIDRSRAVIQSDDDERHAWRSSLASARSAAS